VFIVLVTV